MSGQPPSNPGPSAPRPTGGSSVNGGMAQPRSSDAGLGSGGSSGQVGTMSQQNLNQIVSVRFFSASLELLAIWPLRIESVYCILAFNSAFLVCVPL